jgi:hypothetical protein
MGTDNRAGLTDYFANAIGGGLKFETDTFRHFQLGLSGFYIFNIGSSDLTRRDPNTGGLSRYESGQFDIRDLKNKHDLDRLEELYLKYSRGKSTFVFGRQSIKSPFINLQDGRMRPTAESGVWFESLGDVKNWEFRVGYLFEISPRGTLEWFQIGESVGLYGAGVDETGSRSLYPGKLESKAILLGNLTFQKSPSFKIQYWTLAAHNLFHTQWLQAEGHLPKGWFWGFQAMAQGRLGDGGNPDPNFAFVSRNWKSYSVGGRLGWKSQTWETSLNYTRITSHGRFLMPREWGREPFFTFMARERNEGSGDVHAGVVRISKSFPKYRLRPELAVGYYNLPDPGFALLNKYGMPSYGQINLGLKHEFSGPATGLEAELLAVYKTNLGQTQGNLNYIFNKVDLFHFNAILNFHF